LIGKKGIIRGLAFFPVVAISTNFSTKLLLHKGNKKIPGKQIFIRS
jgi:hypothetical protein